MNVEYCDCTVTCEAACAIADARTGFEWVGWVFAIWGLLAMILCVTFVKERSQLVNTGKRPRQSSMVPSLMNTMHNGPFRVLLPAWACDAYCNAIIQTMVPYYVISVIAPGYQPGCTDPTAPGYNSWTCEQANVIAVCGICVLLSAIVGLPLWKHLVGRLGKVKTWLTWSVIMAVTNVFFVFLGSGWVVPLWIVSALNGMPVGAKFIADSILSDIIDYDEFLTGQRNEATYFMFRGFLPKIVQIPASAIPIAMLGAVGWQPPIGGVAQEQSTQVAIYVKCIVFSCFVMSLVSFWIKKRYPLCTERHLSDLREGIKSQQTTQQAVADPVTGRPYLRMTVSDEQWAAYDALNHFRDYRIVASFLEDPNKSLDDADVVATINASKGANYIHRMTVLQTIAGIVFFLCSITATWFGMGLLTNETWSFVPTFTSVSVGFSIILGLFSCLRLQAATALKNFAKEGTLLPETILQVLKHRELLHKVGTVQEDDEKKRPEMAN